jgi:hypothetical protein
LLFDLRILYALQIYLRCFKVSKSLDPTRQAISCFASQQALYFPFFSEFLVRYFFAYLIQYLEYQKWKFAIRYTIFWYFYSLTFRYFFLCLITKYRILQYWYLYRKWSPLTTVTGHCTRKLVFFLAACIISPWNLNMICSKYCRNKL